MHTELKTTTSEIEGIPFTSTLPTWRSIELRMTVTFSTSATTLKLTASESLCDFSSADFFLGVGTNHRQSKQQRQLEKLYCHQVPNL